MKKIVGMILVIVILTCALVGATAESVQEYLNQFPCTNDVKYAFEHGEHIHSDMCYYDAAVYGVHSELHITSILGYMPSSIKDIETELMQLLEENGFRHSDVRITRVGENNGKDIYRIQIVVFGNLNQDFGNSVLGNGYIGEGKDYNLMVAIGTIN